MKSNEIIFVGMKYLDMKEQSMVWLIKVWYVRAHCTLRATRYGNREEIMTSIIHGLVRTDDQYHHYYHHYNFIHR